MSVILALWAAVTVAVVNGNEYFTGDGTSYTLGNTSAGNCNMMSTYDFAQTDYAALNNEQWDGLQHCGRCVQVSCDDDRCTDRSKSILVQLLDRCPECKFGDLDLSPTVFSALTGSTPSRYKIKWKFTDCPVSGNINYCLKGGSNDFWVAIQPTNVAARVKCLKINGRETTMVPSAYYYVLDSKGMFQTDLKKARISMTDVNGNTIEETLSLSESSCTLGWKQFPADGTQTFQTSSPPTKIPPPTIAPKTPSSNNPPPAISPKTPPNNSPPPTSSQMTPSLQVPTKQTPSTTPQTPCPPSSVPQQQETSPSAVPTSGTKTSKSGLSMTPTSVTSSDDDYVNEIPHLLSNVTDSVDTSSQKPTPNLKTSIEISSPSSDDYPVQQETQQQAGPPAVVVAAPSTNTGQTGDDDPAQTVSTKSADTSKGTDPLIIVLSTLGAVALVAVIILIVIVKRKNIEEQKVRDAVSPSMVSVPSFDVGRTPSTQGHAFGVL